MHRDHASARRLAVHFARVAMLAVIVALIHWQHVQRAAARRNAAQQPVPLAAAQALFPRAVQLGAPAEGRQEVIAEGDESLGFVLQTSPESDHIVGFSGPTNVLIGFGPDERIVGLHVLSSGDTREHVAQVEDDPGLLESFNGMSWEEAAARTDVDAVSGATLTSLAIEESVIHRLGGGKPSLRFPDPPRLETVQTIFADADRIEVDSQYAARWLVKDGQAKQLGWILQTSPAADSTIGYQGPTNTLIGFGPDDKVVGLAVGRSYDNEPYVGYVRDEEYFLTLFNGMTLEELAQLDPYEAQVEGVSGATMTSLAVADGLALAAAQYQQARSAPVREKPALAWTWHDVGAGLVVLTALVVGLTSLRGNRYVRTIFQLVLVGYLGLVVGGLVSQAMLVGWAQSGVPWRTAPGLLLLTVAALLLPVATRRNLYCTHICPHGAAQQLLMNRLPWRWHPSGWLRRLLSLLPALLLVWCLVVAMLALPFSLIDIEPFDAYVFRIAGWATITVAVVGLVASLFVPMAYCRYGCPTGALLNYLRLNAKSGLWTHRDWLALGCLVLAGVLVVV